MAASTKSIVRDFLIQAYEMDVDVALKLEKTRTKE